MILRVIWFCKNTLVYNTYEFFLRISFDLSFNTNIIPTVMKVSFLIEKYVRIKEENTIHRIVCLSWMISTWPHSVQQGYFRNSMEQPMGTIHQNSACLRHLCKAFLKRKPQQWKHYGSSNRANTGTRYDCLRLSLSRLFRCKIIKIFSGDSW